MSARLRAPENQRHRRLPPDSRENQLRIESFAAVAHEAAKHEKRQPLGLAFLLFLERAMGIEPTAQAWEAWVLPLYDAREGRHSMRYCSWVQPFWKTRECTAPLFDPFKR